MTIVMDALSRVCRPIGRRDGVPRGFLRFQALDMLIAYAHRLSYRDGWWERRMLHVPYVTDTPGRHYYTMLDVTPLGYDVEWIDSWNSPATTAKHGYRGEYLQRGALKRARDRLREETGCCELYGQECADVVEQMSDPIGWRLVNTLTRVGVFEDIADDQRRLAQYAGSCGDLMLTRRP